MNEETIANENTIECQVLDRNFGNQTKSDIFPEINTFLINQTLENKSDLASQNQYISDKSIHLPALRIIDATSSTTL